jgi:hypothetical protein
VPVQNQAPVPSPQSVSNRSAPLNAAFRSPAARANLAIGSRNRVKAPGLRLRSDPEVNPSPFGCYTRCRGQLQDSPPGFETATPLQDMSSFDVHPSGSGRSARLHSETLAFPGRPIFLHSPPRENRDRRAADQRSGSATSRQASCSIEPLGTNPMMNLSGSSVNMNFVFQPMNISSAINDLQTLPCGGSVHKTEPGRHVLISSSS